MKKQENLPNKRSSLHELPPLGYRIVKTTVAVVLCLLGYHLLGYRGDDMPTEAAITAIICMQPYVRDTREYAINRLMGTVVGAVWAVLFILLTSLIPAAEQHLFGMYALMGLGVMLSLYTAVLIRKADAASLAAIVFLCIVIRFPYFNAPGQTIVFKILDVFFGTAVAILVNVFRLPRRKEPDKVFFVRTADLAEDQFSQIPSSALFRLNYLYNDGARISLMSEHAPGFLITQLSTARLNTPFIVMDGAAVFDPAESRYLYAETVPEASFSALRSHLESLGLSFFIYTVHNGQTCIFHHGEFGEAEKKIYEHMKRSPYRSYIEEDSYDPAEIACVKVIDAEQRVRELSLRLQPRMAEMGLRLSVRKQADAEGVSALYFYAKAADFAKAQSVLMNRLREKEPQLVPMEIRLHSPYRSERDAMQLLRKLENAYEPVSLFRRR